VRCTDTKFYDNATVIISIDDENDNKPTFDSKRLLFKVEEVYRPGQQLYLFYCFVTLTIFIITYKLYTLELSF